MSNDALRDALEEIVVKGKQTGYGKMALVLIAEKAIADSKPEPQARATNEHTEQIEREELIESLRRMGHVACSSESAILYEAAALLAADKAGGEWPETVMRQWDYWRAEIANGNKTSAPRDWFESLAGYTHPQPQPVPDDVVKDAERYRMLRDKGHGNTSRRPMAWIATGSLMDGVSWVNGEKADIAVDAMLKEEK